MAAMKGHALLFWISKSRLSRVSRRTEKFVDILVQNFLIEELLNWWMNVGIQRILRKRKKKIQFPCDL